MAEPSKEDPTLGHRMMRWLRERAAKWAARYGRDVKSQIIRGVSYGVGSGAVSFLVLWFEARR